MKMNFTGTWGTETGCETHRGGRTLSTREF